MEHNDEQTFEKANWIRRIVACLIDLFVLVFLMLVIVWLVLGYDLFDRYDITFLKTRLLLILTAGLVLFFLKDSFRSVGIGRWIMGITVRNESDNLIPGFSRLLIRNLFIIIWPVEFIVLLANNEKRRIADKVAKTIVVKNPENRHILIRIGSLLLLVIGFFLFVNFYGGAIMTHSDAYYIAIDNIENNEKILEETGGISGFDAVKGSIKMDNNIGKAKFEFTVDGKENDVVVNVCLEKEPNQKWILKEIKYSKI